MAVRFLDNFSSGARGAALCEYLSKRILRSLVTTDGSKKPYPKMRKTLRQNEEEKNVHNEHVRFPLDVYIHH